MKTRILAVAVAVLRLAAFALPVLVLSLAWGGTRQASAAGIQSPQLYIQADTDGDSLSDCSTFPGGDRKCEDVLVGKPFTVQGVLHSLPDFDVATGITSVQFGLDHSVGLSRINRPGLGELVNSEFQVPLVCPGPIEVKGQDPGAGSWFGGCLGLAGFTFQPPLPLLVVEVDYKCTSAGVRQVTMSQGLFATEVGDAAGRPIYDRNGDGGKDIHAPGEPEPLVINCIDPAPPAPPPVRPYGFYVHCLGVPLTWLMRATVIWTQNGRAIGFHYLQCTDNQVFALVVQPPVGANDRHERIDYINRVTGQVAPFCFANFFAPGGAGGGVGGAPPGDGWTDSEQGCPLDPEGDVAFSFRETGPVGGIFRQPAANAAPLEAQRSSSSDAWLLTGGLAVAGALVLSGGAWYVRRRRLR